jgi:hypothetical protein
LAGELGDCRDGEHQRHDPAGDGQVVVSEHRDHERGDQRKKQAGDRPSHERRGPGDDHRTQRDREHSDLDQEAQP